MMTTVFGACISTAQNNNALDKELDQFNSFNEQIWKSQAKSLLKDGLFDSL
jgi:hypothetical protein